MQAASWQPVPPRLIDGESIPPGKRRVISLLSQQFYKAHQAAGWWFYACIEKILWRHRCQLLFLHFAALEEKSKIMDGKIMGGRIRLGQRSFPSVPLRPRERFPACPY
jgi:hypothetical protein